MRKLRLLIILPLVLITVFASSCLAQTFEEEINVVFMYDDELIDCGTITQFKNYKSPTLPDSYVPDGYKFFGWTPADLSVFNTNNKSICLDKKIDTKGDYFRSRCIDPEEMVHYKDVEKYKVNTTVILHALLIDKDDVYKEYHYSLIAWYDNSKSGLDDKLIEQISSALKTYLLSEGVSEEDVNTIIFRSYTGQVGTSCGNIMKDDDVDIMLGWSSRDNVINTGGMKDEMLLETQPLTIKGNNRQIHKLTDNESVNKVFEWLYSDACKGIVQ